MAELRRAAPSCACCARSSRAFASSWQSSPRNHLSCVLHAVSVSSRTCFNALPLDSISCCRVQCTFAHDNLQVNSRQALSRAGHEAQGHLPLHAHAAALSARCGAILGSHAHLCAHCSASAAKMMARPRWRPQNSFSARSSSGWHMACSQAVVGHRSLCTGRLALTALQACLCACTIHVYMGPPHNLQS